MRYYLDTEFDEKQAQLVSIGIVAQDGREFYGVDTDFGWMYAPQWLIDNVKPLLRANIGAKVHVEGPTHFLREKIVEFIGDDHEPEFWGYKCAWDIVLLHRMFGGYNTISENQYPIPLVCHDLTQLARSVGINSIKEKVPPFEPAHHALVDARWNKHVHEQFIVQYNRSV